jgi:L-aminopeptidase/D-esterase-like protein
VEVAAAAVVNSVGDVVNKDGSVLAGARDAEGGWLVEKQPYRLTPQRPPATPGTNTTLVVLATTAALDKVSVHGLAQRAHDGLAIAIRPAHTTHDGDTVFALATGASEEGSFDLVANVAVEVVAEAIRNAVRHAAPVGDVPGLGHGT